MSDEIEFYIRTACAKPLLVPDEERKMAQKIKNGDTQAMKNFLEANTRLVVNVAKSFSAPGMTFGDLINEGNIGLMKAAERYDPEKGRFATFAVHWIRQSIQRAIGNQSRTIRLPIHLQDKINRLSRISRYLQEKLGREPTADEISQESGLDPDRVEFYISASRCTLSLNTKPTEDSDVEIGDCIVDETTPIPGENHDFIAISEILEEALSFIPDREAKIIRMRFGIGGIEPMTLEIIGQKMHLTRERIRQLQSIAIERIRNYLRKKYPKIDVSFCRTCFDEELAEVK